MKMRNLLLTTAGVCGSVATLSAETTKPNFVIFIADDCSYTDIGCYGSVDSKTPNIDNFAKESMLFERGYEAVPMSSPTRHNLYTGVWPVKSGAYPNHTFISNEETETFIQHLRPLGYSTALFGKTHIGPNEKFDFDLLKAGRDINFKALDNYVKECSANDENFCLVVASHEPHSPWTLGDTSLFDSEKLTLPPMWVDTEMTREDYVKYLAEVNYMDNQFGQLLDVLERNNLSEDTVVVYLSEQGNSFPFAKWTLYDVGVHSAYIVRWPGKIEAGVRSDAIVEYVDVVPTFIDFAGGTVPESVDGESMKDVLLGKKDSHKKYTYSIHTTRGIHGGSSYAGIRAVCDGKYRYIINLTPEVTVTNAATEDALFADWKRAGETDKFAREQVYKYQHRPAFELFDVEKDPYCMNNLIDKRKYTAKIVELDTVLRAWMAECGDKGQQTEMEALDYMTPKIVDIFLKKEMEKKQ